MRLTATLRVAYRALGRNKMRSLLTMLGIIIGVGAVIAMVAIGQGANASIQARIASLGTNMLIIMPGSLTSGGVRWGMGGSVRLSVDDAKAIKGRATTVSYTAPVKRGIAQVLYGNQNWSTSIQGTTPEYQIIRDWELEVGSFFTQQDVDSMANVAVLGQAVVENIFGDEDPIGKIIRIKNIPFKVVGVLSVKGQTGMGQDQDDTVIIPFSTAERKVLGTRFLGSVNNILIQARSKEEIQEAQTQVTEILRQMHRIQPNQDDDFIVRNLSDVASAAAEASNVMTLLLGSIAAVSLLVGGIGIMNIMLVSVTERTREIGIRMAVGARNRDILVQFLIEAVVLSLTGGIIGVALGIGGSKFISIWAMWPTLVSVNSIIISFLFSGAVGVFFGFYPARKASLLDPIDALRYE